MDLRSAPKPAFREWNEGMARKYSPGKFHEESHPLIRWIERRRVAALVRIWINSLLTRTMACEAPLIASLGLPIGSSAVAVLRKPTPSGAP